MSDEKDGGGNGGGPMLARVFDTLRRIQEEQRFHRREQQLTNATLRDLAGSLLRMERRMLEQKEDMDLMIRSELAGQLGLLRMEIGSRLDDLGDRVAGLEAEGRP